MPINAHIQASRQLVPLDLVAPGSKGLNTALQGQLMDPSYATVANNAVLDTSGRLAARQGMTNQTTTPLTAVSITAEVIGTGNGSKVTFSGSFAHPNITPSTITITAGAVTGTDNGAGGITGAGIITGTINYITGVFAITFSAAVANATNITANYTYSPVIQTIFEYNAGNQVYTNIVTWSGGGSSNITNPTTNSIAGTASLTSGNWWFQNFNGKMVGFIAGQKPAVYSTGTPVLNTIVESSGTWPLSSGVGCAAFGRVWSVSQSDGQTITYSDLLDETAVGTAGAGQINMASIWNAGTDVITAIFAFNASLVVCGLNHIVFFTDGRGSLLGLDPTQAYVFDLLVGTGCLNQRTAVPMGESDYIFLSPNGVQSIGRLTSDRNNPTYSLTKYVRDTLVNQVNKEVIANISATYNPLTGFYLLSLPTAGIIYCLDQRRRYQDDVGNVCSIVTTWNMNGNAMYTNHSYLTYIARTAGKVALYTGLSDEGLQYTFQWLSPWISFAQQGGPQVSTKLKMLKRYEVIVFTGGNANVNMSWNTDFNQNPSTTTISLTNIGTNSQYGLGQYGLAQYGGGAGTIIVKYDARARGQYYQFGLNIAVGSAFALQQLQAAVKLGRVA
jgi:hypothetical protein